MAAVTGVVSRLHSILCSSQGENTLRSISKSIQGGHLSQNALMLDSCSTYIGFSKRFNETRSSAWDPNLTNWPYHAPNYGQA